MAKQPKQCHWSKPWAISDVLGDGHSRRPWGHLAVMVRRFSRVFRHGNGSVLPLRSHPSLNKFEGAMIRDDRQLQERGLFLAFVASAIAATVAAFFWP